MKNRSFRAWAANPLNCFLVLSLINALLFLPACDKMVKSNNNVLFDFEKEEELDRFRWKCRTRFSLSREYKKHGQSSLKMEFFPTRQVGFSTGKLEHDWSNARAFQFSVFNPSVKKQTIFLWISDCFTEGNPGRAFKTEFEIYPGENMIAVSVSKFCDSSSRRLNLHEIKGFYIFMREISEKTVLYFDCFRLT